MATMYIIIRLMHDHLCLSLVSQMLLSPRSDPQLADRYNKIIHAMGAVGLIYNENSVIWFLTKRLRTFLSLSQGMSDLNFL